MINAKKAKQIYENGLVLLEEKKKRQLKKIIKKIFKNIKSLAGEGCSIYSSNTVSISVPYHVQPKTIWYSALDPSERALILRKLLEKQFDASFDDPYILRISWDIKNDK